MNPITYLCAVLDRLFERNPVAGIIVAILIAFVCAVGIAYVGATPEAPRGVWGA
ncbi:hypothetical protein [Burkholderia stabilis]